MRSNKGIIPEARTEGNKCFDNIFRFARYNSIKTELHFSHEHTIMNKYKSNNDTSKCYVDDVDIFKVLET